ncbi:MAG: NeuD/PglB/VioB family sugar acetyltransferase [Anaerolineales bacterium]|nr:NeuD/PglB/VioB family sugar acetyltransferase [Anaerolineales bacterium]MDW8446445.1 NeuD/PglB/VioB family sugar acetyltransferase [Anaerolineales bacterium]
MDSPAKPILFPLINANEPEMMLVSVTVQQGQKVQAGQVLGVVETTKATAEITAEEEGYIFLVDPRAGRMVRAGEVFGYLSLEPDSDLQSLRLEKQETETLAVEGQWGNLRLTQPAQRLAEEMRVDISRLPRDEWITEQRLRRWIEEERVRAEAAKAQDKVDPAAVLIFGGGGHGKSLIELLRATAQYSIAGVIDDHKPLGEHILGVPVIGRSEDLPDLYARGYRLMVNAVGGIGDLSQRLAVFARSKAAGFDFPTIVHPTAFVEESATLAKGAQVFPHAYIGSEARIGFGVIVNTGAIISHDCQVEDYVNISPGAILAGEVYVGEATLIGMGVTVNLRVRIGAHCRIGNGATVKRDVPDYTIVRAGSVWPP